MPWYKETVMSQRREFIGLIEGSIKVSDACRRFGISRRTGGVRAASGRLKSDVKLFNAFV